MSLARNILSQPVEHLMTLNFKAKHLAIIAALLTLLSLLVAGCGGDGSAAPDDSATADIEGPAFVLFYTDN